MMTLGCEDYFVRLLDQGELIPLVAIVFGSMVGMAGIIAGAASGIMKTRAKEATRRELAAYVAEGTIRPEDAVAMLNAGRPRWECGDARV